ncbi:MAG: right-handed parallel beta-helix repeat-containing protein [Gammaproteobacteria bacterium]
MPFPKALFPSNALAVFRAELARAAVSPEPAATSPALWPRFAGYYQALARLPRKARRALQRRWRRSLGGLALLLALGQAPALAATITVDGTSCTLVDAITAANTDAPVGGCSAGGGADTITLRFQSSTQTLTTVNNSTYGPTSLPVITSEITISGGFRAITRDSSAPEFRILAVGATGNLTLAGTTVSGGAAAFGGGISNSGTLTLSQSTVSGNTAGGVFGRGGGISNYGTLTLSQSTVSGNTASGGLSFGSGRGGGIDNSGTLTLRYSTVAGNMTSGYFGGGIHSSNGTITLTDSTVSGNSAKNDGGGIFGSSGSILTLTNSTVSGKSGSGIQNGGTLTLTNSTVSGNSGRYGGGGISGETVILTNSTVSGNSAAGNGGGISGGALTLTNSTVFGNSAAGNGGGISGGTLTLTNSTIEGNSAQTHGGGIYSSDYFAAMLTLTHTTISDNTAGTTGGGVSNGGLLELTNSTISGNSAGDRGGGVENTGTATLTNSTVSGNTAGDRAAGVYNTGTATFTSSTVSRNASGRVAGGLFNTGRLTLVQSLLSGNTAPVNGPEAYSVAGQSGQGTVVVEGFNVFGHDGSPGVAGFTLGASDVVPAVPVSAILDPTLAYNGGTTRTHALIFGSPAVDAVLGSACATGTDQRGAPRAQDGDGDTFADCDSGAVERGQVPIQAELAGTRLDCRGTTCGIPVRCNLTEAQCTNEVEVVVRTRALRAADGTVTKAARPIRFASGVTNVPPGGTGQVTLRLTKQGKRLVRETTKKRLKGVLGIREIVAATSNTPVTINNTLVTIRLRRR